MDLIRRLFPRRTRQSAALRVRPTTNADGAARQPVRPASQVFTPTRPKTGRRQLVGREAELARILQALLEDRAHVVLYAERGRGKTSLANLVVEALRRREVIVARHTCDAGSDFNSIMRGLMQDLPPALLTAPPGDQAPEGCGAALPPGDLRPGDVVNLPTRLACRSLVCLVDEFDRVEDARTRSRLADTIKQLSDRDIDLRFFVVGVADDLDQILGQHPSIQRNVLGVHLPLFTDRDVMDLITRGGRETGFTFPPSVIARVAALARGMPYVAQLTSLRLAQAAAARDAAVVSDDDLAAAVRRMLSDANPRVVALHSALTDEGRNLEMVAALRRVATAPQDPWGRWQVTAADDGSVTLAGHAISPAVWTRLQNAHVVQACEPGGTLFTCVERSLALHTLLLAVQTASAVQAAHGSTTEGLAAQPRAAHRDDIIARLSSIAI